MDSSFIEYIGKDFDIAIYNVWLKFFLHQQEDFIIDNTLLIFLKFKSMKTFRKSLKNLKIKYEKINSNEIKLKTDMAKCILLTYGIDEIRNFLTKLPEQINKYENYIELQKMALKYQ